MKYNDYLTCGFDVYRRWFNQLFSLSFDGKFIGLLRLGDLLEQFINKLGKMLNRGSHTKPLGDIIVFHLRGHVVKLYNR